MKRAFFGLQVESNMIDPLGGLEFKIYYYKEGLHPLLRCTYRIPGQKLVQSAADTLVSFSHMGFVSFGPYNLIIDPVRVECV